MPVQPRPATRLGHWESRLEFPLICTSVLFLIGYAVDVLAQPQGGLRALVQWIIWATWAVFLVDYLVRLTLAEQRLRWFVRHLLDLAMVALPVLRPLRLLRLITLLSVLQRAAGSRLRGRVVVYVVGSTVVLVAVSALAMLEAERGIADTQITSYGQALWWAMETVSTVGYGDRVPLSDTGHYIAVALMIAGIALLGTVTATLASWLVQKVADQDEAAQSATKTQVAELTSEVQALRELLEQRLPTPVRPVNSP